MVLSPRNYAFILLCSGLCAPGLTAVDPPGPRAVLIDFNVPQSDDGNSDLAIRVKFGGGLKDWVWELEGYICMGEDGADFLLNSLIDSGVKAEIVDKTKVHVLGIEKNGKFYPAVEGSATSKKIPPKHVPKVTNPPQA